MYKLHQYFQILRRYLLIPLESHRHVLTGLLALFLCIEWGPLTVERSRWGIASGDPFVREVAFTFDDGPREWGMYELIGTLRNLEVPATFFVVGKFAERYGFITRDIADAGHEIANHSYTHPRLYALWEEKIMKEAERCNEVVERLGIPVPRFLRPPGGSFNMKIVRVMRKMNMKLGLWNVNSADYTKETAQQIADDVLKKVRPGSVILMHSGLFQTVEAMPVIVETLRERGYGFVTLQDMWNGGLI